MEGRKLQQCNSTTAQTDLLFNSVVSMGLLQSMTSIQILQLSHLDQTSAMALSLDTGLL